MKLGVRPAAAATFTWRTAVSPGAVSSKRVSPFDVGRVVEQDVGHAGDFVNAFQLSRQVRFGGAVGNAVD